MGATVRLAAWHRPRPWFCAEFDPNRLSLDLGLLWFRWSRAFEFHFSLLVVHVNCGLDWRIFENESEEDVRGDREWAAEQAEQRRGEVVRPWRERVAQLARRPHWSAFAQWSDDRVGLDLGVTLDTAGGWFEAIGLLGNVEASAIGCWAEPPRGNRS